jgi:hypothetical protein
MYTTLPIKNTSLVFHGCKIKPADIKKCLLKLTDLSGALNSFSIRTIKTERPRRKLIIDVEFVPGFTLEKYAADFYLYELIANLRRISRSFGEFIRIVPAEIFPELHFYRFNEFMFPANLYKIKSRYFF